MTGIFKSHDMQVCLLRKRSGKTCYTALLASAASLIFISYYLYRDQTACCVDDEYKYIKMDATRDNAKSTTEAKVQTTNGSKAIKVSQRLNSEEQPLYYNSTSISHTYTLSPSCFPLITNTTLYSTCTLEVTLKNYTNKPVSTGGCNKTGLLYSNQLTAEDMTFYDKCLNHTRVMMKGKINSSKCCFMDGSKRAAVALVSHPGSGNTWIRGLLEKATGVCTGSVYSDEELRGAGMRGESVRSGAVIVTKTHEMNPKWTDLYQPGHYKNDPRIPLYGSAILIVRNPYDAFVAEKSRQIALEKHQPSHVSVLNREYFVYTGKNKQWYYTVKQQVKQWSSYFTSWLADGITKGHPIHVVKFENLKLDTLKEVKDMLDFLRFEYEEEELSARIKTDFNTFHRTRKGKDFDHYTMEQRLFVDKAINSTIERLNKLNVTTNLELEKYLRHSS